MTADIEQQLRRAFEHRALQTAISTDLDPDQNASIQRSSTMIRSWLPYAGVAAAAVLVVGLVALGAVRTDQVSPTEQTPTVQSTDPPTAPTAPISAAPRAVATGDVLGISLDDWIGPAAVDTGGRSWTVLDTTQLPADVELIDEAGSVLISPPLDEGGSNVDADFDGMAETYRYAATVAANGIEFDVTVTSSRFGPCSALLDDMQTDRTTIDGTFVTSAPTRTVVDIDGQRAAIDGSLVCWNIDPGVVASVDAIGSSVADRTAAVDLARRIAFTEVDQLPQPTAPVDGDAAPSSGHLAGTLNAVPWLATVEASSLRTMWVYADGQALGGFENDRLSQPTDTRASTGELSLTGVPGAGTLVFGYVAPEVVAVRVTSSSDEVTLLAVLQRENESFFAVPIPDGVVVRTLEFVRADGSGYALAELGPLPADLEGTYGGLVTIRRTPPAAD